MLRFKKIAVLCIRLKLESNKCFAGSTDEYFSFLKSPPCLRRKSLTPRLLNPCHKKKHRILKRIDIRIRAGQLGRQRVLEIFESALSGS